MFSVDGFEFRVAIDGACIADDVRRDIESDASDLALITLLGYWSTAMIQKLHDLDMEEWPVDVDEAYRDLQLDMEMMDERFPADACINLVAV